MESKPSIINRELSAECFIDEIDDFVLENPISSSTPNDQILHNRYYAEQLRTIYREKYGKEALKYKAVMTKLSTYILNAQGIMTKRHSVTASRHLAADQEWFNFELSDSTNKINELKLKIQPNVEESNDTELESIETYISQSSNEELDEIKKSIPSMSKDLERISTRVSSLVSKCPAGKVD